MHTPGAFRLVDLYVDPLAGRISGPSGEEQIDPKVMAVFERLAHQAGTLVTREELLASVWEGRVVTDDVLSRCIYELRKHLVAASGNRSRRKLIRTLPKRGYLLEGRVEPAAENGMPAPQVPTTTTAPARRQNWAAWGVLAFAGIALLAATLWQWADTRPDNPAGGGGDERPTLAVLPFADLSPAGDHGWFADGISEEIIVRLADYRELQVIGRTSSFALRNSNLGSKELSSLLGATYLLEGTVRTEGEGVRVSVRLINQDGIRLWGEDFDRQVFEVMELQQEIADVAASYIVPALALHPAEVVLPDFDAYRQYLLGRNLLARRPAGFSEQAVDYFSQAIALDPDFAAPYAGRAVALYFDTQLQQHQQMRLTQAWQDVELALQLDPRLAEGYAAKALLMERREPQKRKQREALLRKALELDPSLPDAWNWLAGVLMEQGQREQSDQALRQGAKVDPLAPAINVNLAFDTARRGQMSEALGYIHRLQGLPHNSPFVAWSGIALKQSSGKLQEAWHAARQLVLESTPVTGGLSWGYPLAEVYAQLQLDEPARLWLEYSVRDWPDSHLAARLRIIYRLRHLVGYQDALVRMQALMHAANASPQDLPQNVQVDYAELLALTGEPRAAAELLSKAFAGRVGEDNATQAVNALAWSWLQTGETAAAMQRLRALASTQLQNEQLGRLHWSDELAEAALTALLLGDRPLAMDRLRRAVEAGWRHPEQLQQDPRWAEAYGPEFEELQRLMLADIERQRQEVRTLEDPDTFIAEAKGLLATAAAAAPGR